MTFIRTPRAANGFSREVQVHHIAGAEELAIRVGRDETYLGRDDALAMAAYIQESFS